MSDSNLYSRLLLSKGHGYPLFGPQPFDDLPLESRRLGTQIGDVGVVTADGSFDVIFSICRSADDPLNRFGVPQGFEQLRIGPGDIASRPQYHRPGSDVSNTRISKRRLDVDTGVESNVFLPLGAGAVVEISTASKEAAVLLLPDGASRTDLRCMKNQFRDYALKNAHRWYAFVNGTLGMMVESGDLYLVTGMDKSTSWSVAAIENHSEDCRISLKLKAAQIGSAGTSYAWEWETTSSFANSGPRRQPGEEEWTDNQTVFIRGFKVTVRSRPSPLQKSDKVPTLVGSKASEILARSGHVPYSQSSPSIGGSFSRNTSSSSGGGASDEDSVDSLPNTILPYHPATRINEHLLNLFPMIDVAVTHDDEWVAVLNEDDVEMPSDSELMERIDRKYNVEASADGVWLGESGQDDEVPSSSPPPESVVAEVQDDEPPPKRRKRGRSGSGAPINERRPSGGQQLMYNTSQYPSMPQMYGVRPSHRSPSSGSSGTSSLTGAMSETLVPSSRYSGSPPPLFNMTMGQPIGWGQSMSMKTSEPGYSMPYVEQASFSPYRNSPESRSPASFNYPSPPPYNPQNTPLTAEDAEIRWLRKRVRELEQANERAHEQIKAFESGRSALPSPPLSSAFQESWKARTNARIHKFCALNRAGNALCAWHDSRRERRAYPPRMAPPGVLNCGCTFEEALFEESLARQRVGSYLPGDSLRMEPALRNPLLKLLQARYNYKDGDFERDPRTGEWIQGEGHAYWEQQLQSGAPNPS